MDSQVITIRQCKTQGCCDRLAYNLRGWEVRFPSGRKVTAPTHTRAMAAAAVGSEDWLKELVRA